jgi:hypothetical protein
MYSCGGCRGLCAMQQQLARLLVSVTGIEGEGYRRGMTFHEKGPAAASFTLAQPPAVLVLRPFDGCRVTLERTSLRPSTLPKRRTSGRSRSNGSDCRTVRPVGRPGVIIGVNMPVAGRLGPGSP